MEAIVNYESDDGNGNVKITNKSPSKGSMKKKEKRHYSSDSDSSEDSSSSHERSYKEDESKSSSRYSPSPRKSSNKSSKNDKHRSHDSRPDRHRSSSRDRSDRKKKRYEDRDERRKYRDRSRDRERRRERSESYEREDRSERRKDRYDDHKRHRRDNERRYDDKKDYRDRREEHRNSRNSSDARASNSSSSSSSNSSSAIRRAEALNRQIERRASEKVQQLQKLGIEIPTLMQQQQQQLLLKAQNTQIKPLMSINTSVPANIQLNSNTTSTNDTTGEDDKNLTLNLSNFTSSVLTNARYTEQMQKKKLIWGAKKAAEPTTTNNKWEAAKFSQDNDGKVASKFLRLMGMKNVPATTSTPTEDAESGVQKREQMFSSMEQQYEVARQATHTMRGVGLGFGTTRPF